MAAEQNGPIQAIALGAAEATIPTLPNLGTDITYTTTPAWDAFTEIANALGEDDVNFDVVEEALDIEGPLQANRVAEILFKKNVREVSFALYELTGAGLALDGTITLTSSVAEPTTTATYNTLLLEYKGIGVAYFPKVRISWMGLEGGIKKAPTGIKMVAKVFGTMTVPSGCLFKDFVTV